MKNIINYKGMFFVCAGLLTLASCKKNLDIPNPTNQLTVETAFSSKGTIDAMMLGMYGACNATGFGFAGEYTRGGELMADTYFNPNYIGTEDLGDEMTCSLKATDGQLIGYLWPSLYVDIYSANNILENLPNVPTSILSSTLNKAYQGAALTVRAWNYYILVRSWGDVPLITTTDVQKNNLIGRTPVADVYKQIISDLQTAITYLPANPNSLANSVGDVTPRYIKSKYVPEAILSKVYLSQGNWAAAEAAASDVISSGIYSLASINNVFYRTSPETIMSIGESVNSTSAGGYGIAVGTQFVPYPYFPFDVTYCETQLSPSLLSAFEPGDLRLTNWATNAFGSTWQYKYIWSWIYDNIAPPGQEQDWIYVRLAEVYLIRAEARAHQGNLAGAAADLNIVRTRAGLGNTSAATQADMIKAIFHERFVELFAEGWRWDDLIRSGTADAVLSAIPYKAANWKPTEKLWPIPVNELKKNPNLVQNPGY